METDISNNDSLPVTGESEFYCRREDGDTLVFDFVDDELNNWLKSWPADDYYTVKIFDSENTLVALWLGKLNEKRRAGNGQ